jgi:hypothetical protein
VAKTRIQIKRKKQSQKKYRESEMGKLVRKKWLQSENGKASIKKYWQSEKGKQLGKKYHISEKGKIRYTKQKDKAQKIMKELKINGCAICGYDKCDSALHFHHVNNEDKKYRLAMSKLLGKSETNITEELNKCILLCCLCHNEIHEKEKRVK